ncbi:hypothetical protein AK812_SmicGene1469 [Symbiodinium microadriaticum]|uniref:Band 7 domain-containing protein n=1 Tax=Symbiodinium microadriaticum TaxID=2951 RepID=A0A1Q9F3V7_SYMMI|nr:hypothetical protein AK812_SmicGene1469 [Symbiodinium microadriaticum]
MKEQPARKRLENFERIQLLDVRLDQRIENANVRQQVEMQKQATEEMKQKASLIRAKTTVLEADFDRQVKLVNVEADAAAVNITRKAEADAAYNMQEARAEVLRTVQNTVKSGFAPLTNSELLKYMEQGALIEATAGPMIYGDFQSATVFTQTSGEKTPMVRFWGAGDVGGGDGFWRVDGEADGWVAAEEHPTKSGYSLHEGGFIQVSGADLDDPELRVKRRKVSSGPVRQGAELLWEGM